MTPPPRRALGLLNLDVAHKDRERDIRAIQAIAADRKYELTGVITIDGSTYMPITLIAHTAAEQSAVAVVAPSSHHFGEQPDALAHAVTLETWAGTVERVEWDPTR
uniref:hypothetical protein n=1 Tax=Micromonospora sp. NBC_00855 TaxID=2975978 RepID=UPI00224C9661|nr:hypothetical protein OHB51_35290 [Micromonospora sp. NBC_00855]